MLIPGLNSKYGLGNHMHQFFFRLALATAALLPASSVLAADLDIPPPVENLRPATYDWSGPYAGVFVSGITTTGTYDVTCALCGVFPRENNGFGWNGGLKAGWNYQVDSFVMGIEGDWAFGGHVAQNHEPTEMTDTEFNNIATLRARLGMAFDDTLVYLTGGAAFVDSTFSSTDYPTGSGNHSEDSQWLTGYVVGGGIEHAFSDSISASLEYTYMGLPDGEYTLTNATIPSSIDVKNSFDGVHTIRLGMSYNFGW
jgi:outer membrane immunogenic protein